MMDEKSPLSNIKIAVVQLAIGENYLNFFNQSIEDNRKNISYSNYEAKFALFTDQPLKDKSPDFLYKIKGDSWPFTTLKKSYYINVFIEDMERQGESFDYVFYLDVDNIIIKKKNHVFLKEFFLFTSDWTSYYAGCFYGGKTENMRKLSKKMTEEIWHGDIENTLPPPKDDDEFFLSLADGLGFPIEKKHLQDCYVLVYKKGEEYDGWMAQIEKDSMKCHGLTEKIYFEKEGKFGMCSVDLERMAFVVGLYASETKFGLLKKSKLGENIFEILWSEKWDNIRGENFLDLENKKAFRQ